MNIVREAAIEGERDMDREQNSKWKKERSNFSKKFAIPIKKCLVAVNSK